MSVAAPQRVGLVVHTHRPIAVTMARRVATELAEHGVAVRLTAVDAAELGLDELGCSPEAFANGLDLVLALGGDGTMLRAVDIAYEGGAAVLGVNAGQLGYLTEVEPDALDAAMARLLRGDYAVTERMVLQVTVASSGSASGSWTALNETVLEKVHPGRIVRLAVSINGSFFTTYAADGVIVSTPTGSTAYSFSARGPIVSPRHHCLLLTPVSPHMLFDRSLVLDPDEELSFEVVDERSVALVIDGRDCGELAPGDVVTCTAGPRPARIATLAPRDFHQILKAKFQLTDR